MLDMKNKSILEIMDMYGIKYHKASKMEVSACLDKMEDMLIGKGFLQPKESCISSFLSNLDIVNSDFNCKYTFQSDVNDNKKEENPFYNSKYENLPYNLKSKTSIETTKYTQIAA